MVINLKETIDSFSAEIKELRADYTSIYSYFVEYINDIAYREDIELEDFLRNEFSKKDIINSCIWYCENSNASKKTAITKYLNSMTMFCNSFMKEHNYDNKTLFAIELPQLKDEVIHKIKNKQLNDKEVFKPIDDEDFNTICNYLKNKKKRSIKHVQVSIIFKLLMLYGFKLERITYMEKADFDSEKRTLRIRSYDEKLVILELPFSLSNEINNYLNDPNCNQTNFMFANNNGRVVNAAFLTEAFDIIKRNSDNQKDNDRFTSTGLAKFAIIKMLNAGINIPVIKIISGMEDDVINDCLFELDELEILNRFINSHMRSIITYDKV